LARTSNDDGVAVDGKRDSFLEAFAGGAFAADEEVVVVASRRRFFLAAHGFGDFVGQRKEIGHEGILSVSTQGSRLRQ